MYEAGVQADLSERSQGGHAPSASVGRGMGEESRAGQGITDLVSTPALHLPFWSSAPFLLWEGEATPCFGCATLEKSPYFSELWFPPL